MGSRINEHIEYPYARKVIRPITKEEVFDYVFKESKTKIRREPTERFKMKVANDPSDVMLFGLVWDPPGFFEKMLDFMTGKHVIIYGEPNESQKVLLLKAKNARARGALTVHVVVEKPTISL